MDKKDINSFIRESFRRGKGYKDIHDELVRSGIDGSHIMDELNSLGLVSRNNSINSFRFLRYAALVLALPLIYYTSTGLIPRQENSFVSEGQTQVVVPNVRTESPFVNTSSLVLANYNETESEKDRLINGGKSFIDVDLDKMEIYLYEGGEKIKTIKVLTKGKDGSWWETPTGVYKALAKTQKGYSTIGKVWMPYSIQFYGNYLIHGWPYYADGTDVASSFSGGCIRLATADAKIVYEFAKVNMPILIHESYDDKRFTFSKAKPAPKQPDGISADSYVVADLESGEVFSEKNSTKQHEASSLTKLMTAIVAHEVIYLGRSVKKTPNISANVVGIFEPEDGSSYLGLDLLYPLLTQSSDASANLLAAFIGKSTFVKNMNLKASSLEMKDSKFVDATGVSADDVTTAKDTLNLLRYINYKRQFIFDITKGVSFDNIGIIKLGQSIDINNLNNSNEFYSDPDLAGMESGKMPSGKRVSASVWNINVDGEARPVAIVVLSSNDTKGDTEKLLNWIKKSI